MYFYRRKTNQSESADEDAGAETEEAVGSESAAIQDAEVKPSESPIQDDQEHVDSSTTEPIVPDTKEDGEDKAEPEETAEDEKKEETAEKEAAEVSTPAKKKSSRKRSVGKSSIGRSPRSSKYIFVYFPSFLIIHADKY